jgi:predicted dehydrogenase
MAHCVVTEMRPYTVRFQIKLCSRDPSPPPFEYVKGGGGIFADMAVHDLDMSRFLADADPIEILAIGSCHIDKSIEVLPGSEKFDTATCLVRYPNGVQAMVDVCRQSSYGYDQRAEVLGTKGMIQTDNVYPNTARIYKNGESIRLTIVVITIVLLFLPRNPLLYRFHRQCRHALRFLPLTLQRGLRG